MGGEYLMEDPAHPHMKMQMNNGAGVRVPGADRAVGVESIWDLNSQVV